MADTMRPPSLEATWIKMFPATAEFRHGFLGSKKGKRGEWRSVEWRSCSASSFPAFPLSVFPTLRAAFPCAFNKGETRERQTGRAGLRLGEPRVRWRRGCGQEVTSKRGTAVRGTVPWRSGSETKPSELGVATTKKSVHIAHTRSIPMNNVSSFCVFH
jgi:hypothetical protein